ncbi:MAG: hypothetical protein AB3N10_12100, partial [Allomuricauda sp.]
YLIYLVEEGQTDLPSEISFPLGKVQKRLRGKLIGTNTSLKTKKMEDNLVISIPESLKPNLLNTKAFVIKLK